MLALQEPKSGDRLRTAAPTLQRWGVGRATLVLRQLGKEQRGDLVLELLQVLQEDGLQLDVFHYAAAMTAFSHRSWSSAVGLLATARQGMVAVNEYMYSEASAAPWNLVISFLAEMKALRLGNSVSRSAAMKSWSREGQWQVSLAALHGKNSGSRSPAHSLTAAMAACERSSAM